MEQFSVLVAVWEDKRSVANRLHSQSIFRHDLLVSLKWQIGTDLWIHDLMDEIPFCRDFQIDGLLQDSCNYIHNALELLQSCAN